MVTAPQRVPMLVEVPTATEAGYPTFEATNVTGLLAPAGTQLDVVEILNAAMQKVISRPATREKFADLGAEATGGTPEQFGTYIRNDFSKWQRIIKDANVKVE